ncbi:hypothetical protein BX666DRAFT_2023052 [Dichotomocladium elegans]|nr:hypothetical protein BX666DRAFT_2023052 [Dichotomocladium elegans]
MNDPENSEIEAQSSGDEFPEITDQELAVWQDVERKRVHYHSNPWRDEELLQQVLSLRPFEAKTAKERLEKWDQLAQICDSKIKNLNVRPEDQHSFSLGVNAKNRFKIIMKAHHCLLTKSENKLLASITQDTRSFQSLVEQVYEVYVQAGYKPGNSQNKLESDKRMAPVDNRSNEKWITDYERNGTKEVLRSMRALVEMQESMSARWIDEQRKNAEELQKLSESQMEEILGMHQKEIESLANMIMNARNQVHANMERVEERMKEAFKAQETWMEQWTPTQEARHQEWVELYDSWILLHQEHIALQQRLIEMQKRAENSRTAFLRDILKK